MDDDTLTTSVYREMLERRNFKLMFNKIKDLDMMVVRPGCSNALSPAVAQGYI
jgi:hypothetical protein